MAWNGVTVSPSIATGAPPSKVITTSSGSRVTEGSEVYEAPGAIALITAHQELEAVTVERDVARFKKGVDQRWAELTYDGLWFSPLKHALDAFVDDTQKHVSGEVRMTLHGGRAVVTGRRSEASLYDFGMATYDTGDTFDQSLAKGFVQLWGLPSRMAAARDARLSGE